MRFAADPRARYVPLPSRPDAAEHLRPCGRDTHGLQKLASLAQCVFLHQTSGKSNTNVCVRRQKASGVCESGDRHATHTHMSRWSHGVTDVRDTGTHTTNLIHLSTFARCRPHIPTVFDTVCSMTSTSKQTKLSTKTERVALTRVYSHVEGVPVIPQKTTTKESTYNKHTTPSPSSVSVNLYKSQNRCLWRTKSRTYTPIHTKDPKPTRTARM